MIELSLEQINAQSPYEVSYAPNGDFVFATSLNIHYLISFETEEPVGGCNTFQFVIQKLENQRSPHDATLLRYNVITPLYIYRSITIRIITTTPELLARIDAFLGHTLNHWLTT